MNKIQSQLLAQPASEVSTNKVLRNTYLLLSLTLVFSALTAYFAMLTNAAPLHPIALLVGFYGLFFATNAFRNSPLGLLMVFALTGLMGYSLGPILNLYIHSFSNGAELVMTALGATGIIFFSLSAYVTTTRQDFSYMSGFLFIGAMVLLLAILGSFLLNIPGLQLGISAAFVLFSSAMILFQTSQIIHGGERNYIMAAISLYVSIYNLFISLLHLLSAFSGNER
jgi:modulator of FtsH protease